VTASSIDPADPLFRPLTIEQAALRARRSQRTIRKWITDGQITAYEVENPREVVLIEKDVVELEKANRDAFAAGRPRRTSGPSDGDDRAT
jgi:excisionase family DNA binding protein